MAHRSCNFAQLLDIPVMLRTGVLLVGWLFVAQAFGQDSVVTYVPNAGFDSSYVLDYAHMLTARLYGSTKFNAMDLRDRHEGSHIEYRPNTNVNLGVGASYRAITLNIGLSFPFLNRDDLTKGESKYLDAQGNVYAKTYAANLFAQFYRGYYVSALKVPDPLGTIPALEDIPSDLRIRPRMRQFNLGASVLGILKNDRFSYRAAFNQDAWQRKSAGSWLAGGYLSYQSVRAESPMVPDTLAQWFDPVLAFRRMALVDAGGMFGYAHSFVVQEHFFFSVSAVAGAGLAHSGGVLVTSEREEDHDHWGPGLRLQGRSAVGYNSARDYIGVAFVNEFVRAQEAPGASYGWNVGNFRLYFTHRFNATLPLIDRALARLARLARHDRSVP